MAFPKALLARARKVATVTETGEFACPACSLDREYELVVTYESYGFLDRFLPGSRGDVVEILVSCKTCGRRFPNELRDRTLFRDREAEREIVKRLQQNLASPPNPESGSDAPPNPAD